MATKPKFSAAPRPPALTAEQAAFVDTGRGKDKAAGSEANGASSASLAPAATPSPTEAATLPSSPAGVSVPVQRMSIDLPKRLHSRFKAACALAETTMAAEIIAFIERRTGELEGGKEQSH